MSTVTETGGPAPPPDGNPSSSFSVEQALKLASLIVGALYILGLMVSNVQFMDLGIADFSSLQPRSIAVGLLFVVYLTLWAAPWIFLAAAIYGAAGKGTASAYGKGLAYGIFAALVMTAVGTLLFSFFFYAGTSPFVLKLGAAEARFALIGIFHQGLRDWIIAGLVILAMFGIPSARRLIERKDAGGVWFFVLYGGLLIVLPYKLFGYATEIYPNLQYNLGGGQPQIANVRLTGAPPELSGLQDIGLGTLERDGSALVLHDVAIWSQSDKFFYISSARDQLKHRVLGIDIKLVRTIHSLPKYVTVASGGRITKLEDIPR